MEEFAAFFGSFVLFHAPGRAPVQASYHVIGRVEPTGSFYPRQFQGSGFVLSNNYAIPTAGILVGYKTYCVEKQSQFEALIWRPTGDGNGVFTLVGRTALTTNVSYETQTV
jgi:hypothetical protein